MTQVISVAEAKRRFSDVLGSVRYRGERYVVERNGTPMAAIVPLSDIEQHVEQPRSGFLALVGAFTDAPEYAETLDATARDRRRQRSRPAPEIGAP